MLAGPQLAQSHLTVLGINCQCTHNRIMQSPHEYYFNVCQQHKEKCDLVKNYSNWAITGCKKDVIMFIACFK